MKTKPRNKYELWALAKTVRLIILTLAAAHFVLHCSHRPHQVNRSEKQPKQKWTVAKTKWLFILLGATLFCSSPLSYLTAERKSSQKAEEEQSKKDWLPGFILAAVHFIPQLVSTRIRKKIFTENRAEEERWNCKKNCLLPHSYFDSRSLTPNSVSLASDPFLRKCTARNGACELMNEPYY